VRDFPIMPVEPAAPATPANSGAASPANAAPAAAEPGGESKAPAAVEPKTLPPAKQAAVPVASGDPNKAGDKKPDSAARGKADDKPASVTGGEPATAGSNTQPEKSVPVAPVPVSLLRVPAAAASSTETGNKADDVARYRGTFRVPRDGDYHLRLGNSENAKLFVNGDLVRTGQRLPLKTGRRYRVEIEVPNTAAPPTLEVTAAAAD
jgi:hypothetical protein